jgi:UDP-3-O-[3-hydroxymyristoyl] glucosamine N-acyltransferase
MIDQSFFIALGPKSLANLLSDLDVVVSPEKIETSFQGVATLEAGQANDICFFHNLRYKDNLRKTKAGAVVVSPEAAPLVPEQTIPIITPYPFKTFCRIAAQLFEERFPPSLEESNHQRATVSPSAQIGQNVILGNGCIIHAGASIGDGTRIGAYTTLGPGVVIGQNCCIGAHVTISCAILGDHVHIKTGARIGQPGFGFFLEGKDLVPQPQLGRVLIGNHVQIGSNTTIDRGSLKDTTVGNYTQVDNLVQIAHNVQIGEGCIIIAQVGISGSTHIGNGVQIGGQAGIAGHLKIGDGVRVVAQSGVIKSVAPREVIAGMPAIKRNEWYRQAVALRHLVAQKKSKKTP